MRTSNGPMRATLLLAAAFVLLSACGSDDEEARTDGSGTTGTAGVDGTPGGAPGGLFIEVARFGGFVPFGFEFRSLPDVVVYEDGTVVAPGAVPAIFPGPAVLPLFHGRVDEGVLGDLLAAAAEAGIVGATPDVGDPDDLPIADAASTRVTVVVDGDTRVVEAYALEIATGDLGPTRLDDAAVQARARLADLVAVVSEVVVAADEPLAAERYRVLASAPVDPATLDPAGPQPIEVEWPAELPEPVEGACTAVTGDGVALLAERLAIANELSTWRLGERTFSLVVRPVLPHEPDC